MDLREKQVLVYGTGVSGVGAAALLLRVGARVILYDEKETTDPEMIRGKVKAALLEEGSETKEACDNAMDELSLCLGALPQEKVDALDLAVLSPGVPCDIPNVLRLKEAGIPIWGEVELAWQTGKGDVLAITGTNGKTTTTTLLGEIMKYHVSRQSDPKKDQVFVVGNIGTPYTSASLKMTDDTVSVAEISSFQLETMEGFHPVVSAIINITPDHLNRHHTMEEYIRVKERICENQTGDEVCVLNYEDDVLREFGQRAPARVLFFSSARILEEGLCLNGETIELRKEGKIIPVIGIHEVNLLGLHNYENIMTAVGMADAYGVPMEEIRQVLRTFQAVEHRIEFVAEVDGVAYYNDSKGTNPDAAIKAILAMNRPCVLLGGGYDKNSTFDEWVRAFDGKVKELVVIGQTTQKILDACARQGFAAVTPAGSFQEAFDLCRKSAKRGDAVLLSPACASWDMFPNYEERGRVFKEMVSQLIHGNQ